MNLLNVFMAVTIGILVGIAVLQLLQRDVIRIVVGLYIFWNAANLLIIAASRIEGVRAPILYLGDGPVSDPLVQAMVLTAIVITFGFTAFLVMLSYWLAYHGKSIDIQDFSEGRE